MPKKAPKPAPSTKPSKKEAASKAKKTSVKQRQQLGVGADLLRKGKVKPKKGVEKSKKFEILVDGKEVVNEFGYKMKVFVPKGFNGGVDLYFPGGGSGISVPMRRDNIRGKWIEAGKQGSRRALVIVEGRVRPTWKGLKYRYLNKPGALDSVGRTIQSTFDGPPITNYKLCGHSMGGQAIHWLIGHPKVTQCDWYDASYWPKGKILDFARRGGRVQMVFRPGTKTAVVAMGVINRLKLKKVSRNHWQGMNGRVNIYATSQGHSALVNPWMSKFFGTSTTPVRTISPFLDKYRGLNYGGMTVEAMTKADKDNPAGALHKKHLDKIKKIDAKTAEADINTLQDSKIEDVRYNPRLLVKKTGIEKAKEEKDRIKKETQRRMKAYSSGYDGKWITLDYAKMGSDSSGRSHEMYVGLCDVLIDPDITEVLVKRGGRIFKATRGVVKSGRHKGRVAFLDSDGSYVWTHTGDKYRILTKKGKPDSEYLAAFRSETAQREKHEQLWKSEGSPGLGGATALGGISRAPYLSHSNERPSNAAQIDQALTSLILEKHKECVDKGLYTTGGKCESMAIAVSGRVKAAIKDERYKWKSLRRVPLFKKATAKYRGRTVSSLREEDFAKSGESFNTGKIPIGAAIFVARNRPQLEPYMKGEGRRKIAPVVKSSGRHWWIYAGRDPRTGRVMFVDNRGRKKPRNTLAKMKASVGNRMIINIHDPYVYLRGRMYVDKKGRLKEKFNKPPDLSAYTSTGPDSNYFPKTAKGEALWKSIPEAPLVHNDIKIVRNERFVTGKDSFGRTVIFRKTVMRQFYKARALAESGQYSKPPGPKVRLKVTSSYRSKAHQARLNPSGQSTNYVAKPGGSWHHACAMDVVAYVQNPATGKWEGGHRHKNQIYLKKILPLAGWVNLIRKGNRGNEMWHWEIGSTRWKKRTGRRSSPTYAKVMSLNKRRLARYEMPPGMGGGTALA